MIEVLAGILAPVFLVTGLGFAWSKLGMPVERQVITRLVMNVATPCLIVDSVSKLGLPLGNFLTMLASAILLLAGTSACGALILGVSGLPQRSFLPVLTFGNAGNIGLPLSYFAFGDDGLGLSAAVFLTAVVLQFTLAPALQGQVAPLKTLLSTPVVYASILGVGLLGTGAALPFWLDATIGLLADVAIPLSLLTLGFALAEFRIQRMPLALGLGVGRIFLGFGIALAVSQALSLDGVARSILVLHGAMPSAIVCYLLADRYDRHPEEVAGIVLVSTLAAAVLMPLIVSYALWLNGSLPA